MEPVFFDTCTTHPPGQFCRRLISSDYFLSYFDTPFRYETAGKLVTADAGDMLILEPGVPVFHGPAENAEEGFVNDWIYIRGEELGKLLENYPLPLNLAFSVGKQNILRPYIDKMHKEKSLQSPGYRDSIYFLTGQLIIDLYRLHRSNLPGFAADRQLEQVRESVLLQPERNWPLKEMALMSGYSVSRFACLYKEKFGCSPKQELLNARIQLAMRLLKYTNQSVSEISSACGFQSIHYFSKYFKSITGISPKGYIASSRHP